MAIALILFFVFFPAVILYLCHRFAWLNKIGSVVIAYIAGLLLGNVIGIPDELNPVQEITATISIPLGIPLLLFSANIKRWFSIAGRTMISMLVAIFSVVIVVTAGYFIFEKKLTDAEKIAGMLVGVYTGGTPNLASIKTALGVNAEAYLMTHTYDLILSAIYLLFLLTIGQRFFHLFLPKFTIRKDTGEKEARERFAEDIDDYRGIFSRKRFIPLLKALGLSVFIFLIGGGLSFIVPERFSMVSAILCITTLGLLFSLFPSVNKIEKSFQVGMYFILIFSIDVASMANISQFINETPYLFYYVTVAIFGTFFLHLVFSFIFRIDADTVIITSTALILSPPFVPVIAGALKNKEIIISGLTVGIIGYAIGNYLGVFIAYAL